MIVISPWPLPDISIYISRYRSTYQEDRHHNTQVCLRIPEDLEIDSPSPDRSWLQKLVHSLHYGLRNSKTPWFYCSGEQWMLVERLSVSRAALGHLDHADHLSPSPSTPMMLQLPVVRERPGFDVADIQHTQWQYWRSPHSISDKELKRHVYTPTQTKWPYPEGHYSRLNCAQ